MNPAYNVKAGNKTLDIKRLDKGDVMGLQFMVVFRVSSQTLLLLVKSRSFPHLKKKKKNLAKHIHHFIECFYICKKLIIFI